MKLDTVDLQVLDTLQKNSRITTKNLAKQLGLTTTPVFERIKKLEREKIIDNYVALVNPKKMGLSMSAFISISLKEHTRSFLDKFIDKVNSFKEVTECYHIAGDNDFILKVIVKDIDAYQTFILTKLSLVSHLGHVKTQFILSKIKNTPPGLSL